MTYEMAAWLLNWLAEATKAEVSAAMKGVQEFLKDMGGVSTQAL